MRSDERVCAQCCLRSGACRWSSHQIFVSFHVSNVSMICDLPIVSPRGGLKKDPFVVVYDNDNITKNNDNRFVVSVLFGIY